MTKSSGTPKIDPASKILVSVEEAAELISISRAHLYPLLMRGEIESLKIGRNRLVRVSALEEYIQRLLDEQSRSSGSGVGQVAS